jgi:hypothetical protein
MSFILDPTGSIYTPKTDSRVRPSWVHITQSIAAGDANQIRDALFDLRDAYLGVSGTSGSALAPVILSISQSMVAQSGVLYPLSESHYALSASYYPLSTSFVAVSSTVAASSMTATLALSQSFVELSNSFVALSQTVVARGAPFMPTFAGLYHSGTAVTDPVMTMVANVWSVISGDLVTGDTLDGRIIVDAANGTMSVVSGGHYHAFAAVSLELSIARLAHIGFATGTALNNLISTEIYDAAGDIGNDKTTQLVSSGIIYMPSGTMIAVRAQVDAGANLTMHHMNFLLNRLA